MCAPLVIDSSSGGNPERFRTLADLERGLGGLPAAPTGTGRVALLVRRGAGGRREVLERVHLGPDAGVPGDAWGRRAEPRRDMQVAVMQRDVAALIANGQPLTLFGDNLFLDLDLGGRNLPVGSRVRAGHALLEVTPMPHNGCRKFRARFGDDALRFVSAPGLQDRRLRGVYMCVVEGGEVGVGDLVEVLARG
jgi:MOSC domain-containing protein YiiM